MLAVTGNDKEGGDNASVIHVRQREGQQRWLSVRQWEVRYRPNRLIRAQSTDR